MQSTDEDEAEAGSLLNTVTSFLPSLSGLTDIGATSTADTRFRPRPIRGRPPFEDRPPLRGRPPFRSGPPRRPPPIRGGQFNRRRGRRQASSIPGNILRLLQVTGLNSLNAYPYIRAAMVGQSSRPITRASIRRRNSCAQIYRDCPTEPDRILDYLNNHNGGLINQVQPDVDNEVAPIVSAIVNEAIQDTRLFDTSSSSSQSSGPSNDPAADPLGITSLLDTGDAVLTQALIQGASGYLADGISSLASTINGGKKKK